MEMDHNRFREFINNHEWTFAKTYAAFCPHEYLVMRRWYAAYLKTEEALENIAVFDRTLPGYKWLTDIKKIDYLLWCKR